VSQKTLLRRLLEAMRTYDDGDQTGATGEVLTEHIRTRDFYGSPLNEIEFAVPYPTLPIGKSTQWDGSQFRGVTPQTFGAPVKSVFEIGQLAIRMKEADETLDAPQLERYPPHVALAAIDPAQMLEDNPVVKVLSADLSPDNDPAQIPEDIDLLSAWPIPPLSGEGALPVRVVVFLETLRCIAAPKTDTNVDRLDKGLLTPKKLPKGYLSQHLRGFNGPLVIKDNEPTGRVLNDAEQRKLFRQTFLAVYTHLLLRHLAVKRPEFIASVVDTEDSQKRGLLFKQSLKNVADPNWAAAIRAAYHCIRTDKFRDLYLEPIHFLKGLGGLDFQPLHFGGFRVQPADRFIRLPATLEAILHLCIDRAGSKGELYADHCQWMHEALDDERRIERADEILQPDKWHLHTFPAGGSQHELGPGVSLATWSCLCAVLEALAAGVLKADLDAPDGAPPQDE
jgi:hypothetical protein